MNSPRLILFLICGFLFCGCNKSSVDAGDYLRVFDFRWGDQIDGRWKVTYSPPAKEFVFSEEDAILAHATHFPNSDLTVVYPEHATGVAKLNLWVEDEGEMVEFGTLPLYPREHLWVENEPTWVSFDADGNLTPSTVLPKPSLGIAFKVQRFTTK